MDITATDSHLGEIFLEFFSHPLGESRHKHTLVELFPLADFFKKVIDLILCRAHFDRRIKEAGRTDNLLYHKSFRLFKFIIGWSRADKDLLCRYSLELLELQRPVVHCGRKTEAIFHKHGLARMVTPVHCPDLRKSHMALIDEGDEILREIIY